MDYSSIPKDIAIEVTIFSEAPPGCSTGTSAAVSVALLGALDTLTAGRMTPYQVAMAAFHVETQLLKQQCGIQDQIAAAHGGINFIDMHEYPHASVSRIDVPAAVWWELESRLVLVYVGSSHSSRLRCSSQDVMDRAGHPISDVGFTISICSLMAYGDAIVRLAKQIGAARKSEPSMRSLRSPRPVRRSIE